jgi:hypothetical protein
LVQQRTGVDRCGRWGGSGTKLNTVHR